MKCILACGIVIGAVGMSISAVREAATAVRPTRGPIALLAIELGLDPESLAVAGCDASAADQLLRRLDEADSIRAEYVVALAHLEESVQALAVSAEAMSADPDDRVRREQYLQDVNGVQSALEGAARVRRTLVHAAFEGLPPELLSEWSACESARCFRLPRSFLVAPRPPAQASDLERCLLAERRAARLGRQLAPEMAQLLDGVRSDPSVLSAQQQCATHVAPIQGVFDLF